jgi:DsbC/DsbD-like thiol-disulfide interchange protein
MVPAANEENAMRAVRSAAVAAALVVVAAPPPAGSESTKAPQASSWVELPGSRVRLVASGARTAGGGYLAGVEIVMEDGWKTYWRTPGDSGVPPSFQWKASTNAAAVKVLYPAPTRMPEAGAEVIGYKKAVLFPLEVKPQDASRPVALRLALEYGICRDICVAATATLELALAPGRVTGKADVVKAALERVPRPGAERRKTDPWWKRVANVDGETGGSRLEIDVMFPGGSKGADLFIEAPDGLSVPLPRKLGENAQGVVRYAVELAPAETKDLRGKTLTLTMVSDAGASEGQWTFP